MSIINLFVCNRHLPLNQVGGSAAGVKNAEEVLSSNSNRFLYLGGMSTVQLYKTIIKCFRLGSNVIAHDIDSCVYFCLNRPHLVYHSQGDSVSELKNYRNYRLRHIIFVFIKQYLALFVCKKITFPTIGAAEIFISGSSIKRFFVSRKSTRPLYGFYEAPESLQLKSRYYQKYTDKIHLLTVSSLIDNKNVESLPQLVNSKFRGLNYFWTIVGRGPFEEELRKNIKKFGIDSNVKLITNYISDEELNDIYISSDVFIMNHKVAICDRAIGQAMYHKLAIILSDLKSHRELREQSEAIIFWDDFHTFDEVYEDLRSKAKNDSGYVHLWSRGALRARYLSIFNIS